jgi:hypothetical protein
MDKGSQKGTKKGAESYGVHSNLFSALFSRKFVLAPTHFVHINLTPEQGIQPPDGTWSAPANL